jgi:single-stranded-DNA-specific exonuclease
MNIKYLNSELNIDNFLENMLYREGIYDIDGFLNIDETVIEEPEHYNNMERGYNLLKNNLEKIIGILIDCDVDGYTSASEMCLYIQELNPMAEIKLFFHQGFQSKQHGLTDKVVTQEILKSGINLLIIPDAGSNDLEEHKKIKDKGIDILILDHHECDIESTDAVVINNQMSPKVENKQFSGAGVVYKFLQYCDRRENLEIADNYLDLVALGNVSDMVSMLSDETRYLCINGLKEDKLLNILFIDLIKKYIKDDITMDGISWNVTPKINSIIRAGSETDKIELFEAFINPTKQVEFKKNSRTPMAIVDLSTKVTQISEQIKKKQDDDVKASLKEFTEKIDFAKKVLIIKLEEEVLDKAYTGLVANKLMGTYNKPVLLLQKSKSKNKVGLYTGSARCPNLCYDIENFKEFVASSNLLELAEGHSGAFGIEIKEDNIELFINWMEEILKDKIAKVENTYEVEGEISAEDLKNDFISEVASYNYLWGAELKEPKFYITGINISNKDIKMVFNKTILTFRYNGINYEKTYCSKAFRESLFVDKDGKEVEETYDLELNIVGKFIIEHYNGKDYPKVSIVDFEFVDYE